MGHSRLFRAGSRRRRGAILVEFAIVLPIFLLALIGIIEFGRAIMVQQILTNAAREGARRAIIPGATDVQVTTLVDNYLVNTSLDAPTARVDILPSGKWTHQRGVYAIFSTAEAWSQQREPD